MNDLVSDENAHLLRLARQAGGKVGADIERAVREARGKARRERRPLVYADLEAALQTGAPRLAGPARHRCSVHEAGHAIAYHALGLGSVVRISVDDEHGGTTTVLPDPTLDQDESHFSAQLAYLMAGRAAELELIGNVSGGSGAIPGSDLDQATRLAAMIEAAMGYGAEHPLLFHGREDRDLRLVYDRDFAARVHVRIKDAEETARGLVRQSVGEIERMAALLERDGAIESYEQQTGI